MEIFRLHRGSAPLLISLPHDGEHLPAEVVARLTPDARRLPDTDWHVGRLYDFARELGASILRPHYSRYLVDLNRPPDDLSLYPGQNTTGLCPSVQFNGQPVYLDGEAPTPDEIAQRVDRYWRPYHEAVAAELQRLRAEHGRAVLWEGHSIRSVVPYLFDGRLPDFNLGTANGATCSPALQQALESVLAAQREYSWVANGRFKGGYITRHFGRPQEGIDAVQLELAQCNYMDEDSFAYDGALAAPTQGLIRRLLEACLAAPDSR
ncbi:MAG: N-formylglutamate deformylase [Chiayiivirga sp.]|jgi:N-formylglutamate deformylase|uniref:N-formylglutamate deformylase n=1 Tax=Chiayiivirga sp. TaxID=2041042 RepID=UPI0025C0869D|nr:N-formylglutamate deformylase [Chiayiivirga sp.]MCI1709508.1 N-formylglutamate deformylase [Chiayiivirga sp.]MCI1730204.1 N-formylglutamate deformylase [Chiayiivirga sp.]